MVPMHQGLPDGDAQPAPWNNASFNRFTEAHSYKLTDFKGITGEFAGGAFEPPRRSKDDLMRYVYEWGRNRRLDVERSMGRCPVRVPAIHFRNFVSRLDEFKADKNLLDFTDVLELVLDEGLRPDVDVAFVDEAQDLSPLQIAAVESWFKPCKRVFVAGDEDQAIYSFQGAEPEWLMSLTEKHVMVILNESHRVPAAIHDVAQRIIRRNRNRIGKDYKPAATEGKVEFLSFERALKLIDDQTETFVLARNRMFLKPVADDLLSRGLPYVVEGSGGTSPLSSEATIKGTRAAYKLWRGEVVSARALDMLMQLVPSRGHDLLPYGVKVRVKGLKGDVSHDQMRELGLGKMLDEIQQDGPTSVLLKLKPKARAYLKGLLDCYGDIPKPKVRLTSIHAAKGREADLVIVIPDMTKTTYLEYMDGKYGGNEAENRVAYVAVTRAKKHLVITNPTTRRFYHYPQVENKKQVKQSA